MYLSSSQPPHLYLRQRIDPEEAGLAKIYISWPLFASKTYGVEDGDPIIQKVGDVVLQKDRVVVHPNTFQAKLDSFGLEDARTPSH